MCDYLGMRRPMAARCGFPSLPAANAPGSAKILVLFTDFAGKS